MYIFLGGKIKCMHIIKMDEDFDGLDLDPLVPVDLDDTDNQLLNNYPYI